MENSLQNLVNVVKNALWQLIVAYRLNKENSIASDAWIDRYMVDG